MVRVPALPVGQDHHAGAQLTQHADDLQAVLPGVFHATVGQIERLTPAHFEDARSGVGLGGALRGRAAGAGFALRQVEDPGFQPERAHFEQRAAAGLLHIVTMGGDGEDVYDAVCG